MTTHPTAMSLDHFLVAQQYTTFYSAGTDKNLTFKGITTLGGGGLAAEKGHGLGRDPPHVRGGQRRIENREIRQRVIQPAVEQGAGLLTVRCSGVASTMTVDPPRAWETALPNRFCRMVAHKTESVSNSASAAVTSNLTWRFVAMSSKRETAEAMLVERFTASITTGCLPASARARSESLSKRFRHSPPNLTARPCLPDKTVNSTRFHHHQMTCP